MRSTARNDVKRHAEDNSPKYRMVGKMISHPELDSVAINVDNRLRNKCAMTGYGHAELVSVSCNLAVLVRS